MAYSNGSLQIHGSGVSTFSGSPKIYITINASDVTRSGSSLECAVSASLNAISRTSRFGYSIDVYAQLDNGPINNIVSKGNSPSRWSSGSYGTGTATLNSNNNMTTSARLN